MSDEPPNDRNATHEALITIARALKDGGVSRNTSDYETLNNMARRYNEILARLRDDVEKALDRAERSEEPARDDVWAAARTLIIRLLHADLAATSRQLRATAADDRAAITPENVGDLERGLDSYLDLLMVARQTIDVLVTNAYLYSDLKAGELNYAILSSLSSFEQFAPESLSSRITADPALRDLLTAFEAVHHRKRKDWSPTKASAPSFAKRIEALNVRLDDGNDNLEGRRAVRLYRFASEYTHMGLMAVVASRPRMSVTFGDGIGPYLPSTENFAEVRLEVLDTTLRLILRYYVRSAYRALGTAYPALSDELHGTLGAAIERADRDLRLLARSYVLEVRPGVSLPQCYDIACPCGGTIAIGADRPFCRGCGSMLSDGTTRDLDPPVYTKIVLPDGTVLEARLNGVSTIRMRPTLGSSALTE